MKQWYDAFVTAAINSGMENTGVVYERKISYLAGADGEKNHATTPLSGDLGL